jgi:hypothetical protein
VPIELTESGTMRRASDTLPKKALESMPVRVDGNVRVVRLAHPSNALALIHVSTEGSGMVKAFKLEHPLNADVPMYVRYEVEFGMLTVANDLQPSKALSPMVPILIPKVTDRRAVQSANAPLPIVDTTSGNKRARRAEQLLQKPDAIDAKESPKVIDSSTGHPLKLPPSIVTLTLLPSFTDRSALHRLKGPTDVTLSMTTTSETRSHPL